MHESSAFDVIEEEDKVDSAISPDKRAAQVNRNGSIVKRFNMRNH